MKLKTIICVVLSLHSLHGLAIKYSDDQIKSMIDDFLESRYQRCPRIDNHDGYKQRHSIQEGYERNLYSVIARDELLNKRFYPISFDLGSEYIISHVCPF